MPIRPEDAKLSEPTKAHPDSTTEVVYKMSFSGKDLKSMPAQHSALLIVISLAVNDLTVINRTLLTALNAFKVAKASGDQTLAEYAYVQTRVIARIASAKAFEFLDLVEQHKKRCERANDSFGIAFHKKWRGRIATARAATGYATAEWLRHKFTNHYDLKQGRDVVAAVSDDQTADVYLHQKEGNTGSFLGEQVAIIGGAAQRGDPLKILSDWEDWVLGTLRLIFRFHSGFMIAIVDRFFSDKAAVAQRVRVPKSLHGTLGVSSLPVFWEVPA